MAFSPTFHYSLGGAEIPVSPGSSLWQRPLPMDRHYFRRDDTGDTVGGSFTHGDYFMAARYFLEREWFHSAAATFSHEQTDQISDIYICLMKHGEFYHPARIRLVSNKQYRSFVLNVAISEPGRRVIHTEISALKRLGDLPVPSFVPKIYGKGSVELGDNLTADMFLGEWFEGYHEFHLSRSQTGGAQTLCVWGEYDIPYYLTTEEAYLLYHQAARILTLYFNLATTEHISHWHHAAGDFVIKRESNGVAVKLITVRKYGHFLQAEKAIHAPNRKRGQSMTALLLFLLTLSIRMRLDRLDGVGDTAWADDTAVIGVWTGFLDGIAGSYFPFTSNPAAQFEDYLSTYSTTGLYDLSRTLLTTLPITSSEKALVEANIGRHMEVLCDTISRIGFS